MKTFLNLVERASKDPRRFPPTLIYNEGWMLRLVLDWFHRHNVRGHILTFIPDSEWFSEALLPSPFSPRRRGDPRAEARTHADGLIGHFKIGGAAKVDAQVLPEAKQFVVTEAKMSSSLSAGTRNAPAYDQAARSVACMAEMLARANVQPSQLKSFAFIVIAPHHNLEQGLVGQKLSKPSIRDSVHARAQAFQSELGSWFEEWFLPALDLLIIEPIAWEDLIATIRSVDPKSSEELSRFYEGCLKYSSLAFLPN